MKQLEEGLITGLMTGRTDLLVTDPFRNNLRSLNIIIMRKELKLLKVAYIYIDYRLYKNGGTY